MTLKKKIILSFSLSFSIILMLGIFVYLTFINIRDEIRFLELSDTIRSKSLQIRRHEKNFLLYRDFKEADKVSSYIAEIKELIKQNSLNDKTIPLLSQLNHKLDEYEERFGKIMQATTFLESSLKRFKSQNTQYSYIFTFIGSAFLDYPLETAELLKRFHVTEQDKRIEALKNIKSDTISLREIGEGILTISKELDKSVRQRAENTIRFLGITTCVLLPLSFLTGFIGLFVVTHGVVIRLRGFMRTVEKIGKGDFSAFPILSKQDDEVNNLMILFNNMVLDLKDRETELIEAEKRASIGIIAAGIAHELNNPLTSVLTFSNLMLEQTPEDNPNYKKLKMMASETERARNIVKQLLTFAKEIPLNIRKVNINQPIREILDSLLAQGAFNNIELTISLSDSLPEINADPAQIGQVALNILSNAIHAITPPGVIEVLTRTADKFVEIIFSDTGCGIPEEHINKIFNPFFTTKEIDRGVGLGLAVSYGIIKKHGGNIEVKSTVGKGSIFIVRLPING